MHEGRRTLTKGARLHMSACMKAGEPLPRMHNYTWGACMKAGELLPRTHDYTWDACMKVGELLPRMHDYTWGTCMNAGEPLPRVHTYAYRWDAFMNADIFQLREKLQLSNILKTPRSFLVRPLIHTHTHTSSFYAFLLSETFLLGGNTIPCLIPRLKNLASTH